MIRIRHCLAVLLAAILFGTNGFATWSIVVIDTATGEVCVAAATCLEDFRLKRALPVILVGKGAAAAQSFIDTNGQNRIRIRDDLLLGLTPARILDDLAAHDGQHHTRQYGIVSMDGIPVTFSGTGAGHAKHGVTGRIGSLFYAIQGNVLTGDVVVTAAEQALLGTEGDLSQRVMAGMEAARAMGGDGRCSCLPNNPTGCGAPPPSFTKSAHTSFIVLARLGDTDGNCLASDGCANGSYYLVRKARGNSADPDPIIELQRRYLRWREIKSGLPDQLLSRVEPAAQRLVADGITQTQVTVALVDLDGVPLQLGGDLLTVTDLSSGGNPVAIAGAVSDHGDGTYSFALQATHNPGVGQFQLNVLSGTQDIQLHPPLSILVEAPADLHVGWSSISSSVGAVVPFVVQRSANAGELSRIFASASGTSPGTPFGGGTLPLNPDRLLFWTLGNPQTLFPGSHGVLDAGGRMEASLDASPSLLAPFVGGRFDFCAAIGNSSPLFFTNVVGFQLLP